MTEKRKRYSASFGFYFNSDILKRFRCSLPKTDRRHKIRLLKLQEIAKRIQNMRVTIKSWRRVSAKLFRHNGQSSRHPVPFSSYPFIILYFAASRAPVGDNRNYTCV